MQDYESPHAAMPDARKFLSMTAFRILHDNPALNTLSLSDISSDVPHSRKSFECNSPSYIIVDFGDAANLLI